MIKPTPEIHRLLPQSVDAERAMLSAFLIAPDWVTGTLANRGVREEWFHLPAHQIIYRRMAEMIEKREPVDIVTLTQKIRERQELDQAGGPALITELFTFMPTATNVEYHAAIVEKKHVARKIIMAGTQYASEAYEEQEDITGLLDRFEVEVCAIRKNDDSELREMEPRDAVMEVIKNIEDAYDRRGAVSGQTTGYPAIDEMLDGMHEEEMIVIAARPSMGKTALAMNIAEHIAFESDKTVAVFTLEMSIKQLYQRVLLSRSRVNLHRVRMGFLNDSDFPKITATAGKMASSSKLRIVDAIGASINAIRAKARRMAKKHPDLACIVVDYLQKVRSTSRQAQSNREREIAEISSGLKDLAKELKIPIVVLAQLNRQAESRKGSQKGRPQLSDLRESGAIEQDADVVGLLYREEYYADGEDEKREVEGKATIIIAKNRNGPVGDVPLTFLKEFARYESRGRSESDDATEQKRNWHEKP